MHPIKVRNGSPLCTAMKLTIGAFHFGASRLRMVSALLTARASRGRASVFDCFGSFAGDLIATGTLHDLSLARSRLNRCAPFI